MRILAVLTILCVGLAFGTGCVQSPTGPGLIFMNVKGPLGAGGGTDTSKKGRACVRVIFQLFAWGDASIEAAKADGGITEVTTIDHQSFNLIGFASFCTHVYGS